MFSFKRTIVAAALVMASAAASTAVGATLKAGDPAPALAVGKFVKGEPVQAFEKGKIYVVEFWATWCPPCRESIPHLSIMQAANPDVVFIGSDVGEKEETVAPFVTKMGDKMDYRVAIDKPDNANNAAFMEAAGQNGIPTAFVIDKETKVAWIGHPMELEPVLKQVVAGTFDVKKAAASAEMKQKVMTAAQSGDFDGAIKAAQEAIDADPSQAGPMGLLQFEMLVQGKKDLPAATKKADALLPTLDDADMLNAIAWSLATASGATPDALSTAQKASDKSLEKSPASAECMDTRARVYAVNKDFKSAADLEAKAIDACKDDTLKGQLTKTLEAYKAGKLPANEE